ncbi:MAG TPA: hypothetical protein DCE56_05865 [Cyanobacteria bacterium UBA8553]|nr:hypothetical protein [Cyanobacteria bacterium UBA8553]
MSKPLLTISKLDHVTAARIPGFFVASTAPINVEGDDLPAHRQQVPRSQQTNIQQEEDHLNLLADLLYQKVSQTSNHKSDFVEIILSTHGFSNSKEATKQRIEEIYDYLNKDHQQSVCYRSKNLMYIGYRWPSEPLMGNVAWIAEKLCHAVSTLPLLARTILIFGSIGILISLFFKPKELLVFSLLSFIVSIIILILTTAFFFVVTLIILRLVVYFRDNYRATHFGVPDLVELIRQLDKALFSKAKQDCIDEVKLISKLEHHFLQKLKHQLTLEGIIITNHEEAALELISKKVVRDYCKEKSVDKVKVEDLGIQDFEDNNKFTKQGNIDIVVKIAQELLIQDTEVDFVKLRETSVEILENKARKYWENKNRIKLSFIGHSLGAEVITSTVRILSDVFDLNSVGNLGVTDKLPTSNIGRVFSLERLILVSPDIPISTILSGRANVLRSSIRRFKEAYLFSNEGDLALRLASTLANYFSFPARTREGGFRLGNVAIQNNKGYGIFNLDSLQNKEHSRLLKYLIIDSFNLHGSLAEIQDKYRFEEVEDKEKIANLFTYFDCTDYTDRLTNQSSQKKRVLSLEMWNWEPRSLYYLRLIIAYSLGIKDTHGGYFQGEFSQQLIYRLAFLGFGGFLDSLDPDSRTSALDYLSQECRQKKIQVILSPERYEVDMLERDRAQVRKEMLNVSRESPLSAKQSGEG